MPEDVELDIDLNADVEIYIDKERIRQAILNVVENACQSMQQSKARPQRLRLSSRLEDDQHPDQ